MQKQFVKKTYGLFKPEKNGNGFAFCVNKIMNAPVCADCDSLGGRLKIDVKKNAVAKINAFLTDSESFDLQIVLSEHSSIKLNFIFRASGGRRQRISVNCGVNVPFAVCDINIKGVVEGDSYVNCAGMISVSDNGNGAEVSLKESVLLLDEGSKADLIPGLNIQNNDVKAVHSAGVSKINPEKLFYFMSRGICEREAKKMIAEGFIHTIAE